MPRFFIKSEQINDGVARLIGEDAHHAARSLRMAVGDELTLCDESGVEYLCDIVEFIDDKEVIARIRSQKSSDTEPPYHISLFQALPKGDKLDSIIQKSVECGASDIYLFQSERCVVKIKKDAEDRKNERRQRIAESAAKQCGRSIIPSVHEATEFGEMLKLASGSDLALFCYEGEGTVPLGKVLKDKLLGGASEVKSIAIIIGREGGFSENEVAMAKEAGMIAIGLGKRILRTETASSFALACVSCVTELC